MSGLDAAFLRAETPDALMHTLKVLVLELPRPTVDLEGRLLAQLARHARDLHALHAHAELPPGGTPRWERVEVDVRRHLEVRHLCRASWRRRDEVERALSGFVSTPLDRGRPLWRLLALVDEERRELTLALKIHHALADGRAAARMLERVAGAPAIREAPTPRARWRDLPALLARTLRGLWRARDVARATGAPPPLPFTGVRTHFTRPVQGSRELAFARLPLEEVKRVKDAAGVKLNDVVLALSAAALRGELERVGAPPSRPLSAAIPVSVEGGGGREMGNVLSNMFVHLHADEADPWARLRRQARASAAAKAVHEARGADLLMRWTDLLPGRLVSLTWRLVRAWGRAPVDVVISNVPGPRRALWLDGLRLKRLASSGPLLPTTGLNLTFWSYDGWLEACVHGCAAHGTDVRGVARGLELALEELRARPRDHALAA